MNSVAGATSAEPRRAALDDRASLNRIKAEFSEMPGLRLTLPQAARVFGLDRTRCERLLYELVRQRVLWTDGCWFALTEAGRRSA